MLPRVCITAAGTAYPMPIVLHNVASPEDAAIPEKLRSGCPANKTEESIDVEVAVKLVKNEQLYRQALGLGLPNTVMTGEAARGAGSIDRTSRDRTSRGTAPVGRTR